MKVSNKLVDEVVAQVAGEDVIPLVSYLKNKKNISEFKIAECIKVEINLTRNMLYRLFDHNLVSFIRRKDKKKGWYIYYWTFNGKMIKFLVQTLKKARLDKLKDRLKREQSGQFYSCGDNCIRLDFEQATNFEFKCPECGKLLDLDDNVGKIVEIEKEIKELVRDLKKEKPVAS
jgi:transcription initiation factor TFIIE subunit alpha